MENAKKPEKEFGKLTTEQFQTLVNDLPEIRAQMNELPDLVRNIPNVGLRELLDGDFVWSEVYELPFASFMALFVASLGQCKAIHDITTSTDPQQALIEWGKTDLPDWDGGEGGAFTMSNVVGLLTALQRNVLCIMLYHRTLCDLVKSVRDKGDEADDDFFKAIKIDRSVMTCDTFARRISKAELLNDRKFFTHLHRSLKSIPKKDWESYRDLRYGFALLRDCGFNKLSDAQLEDLFVHKLKLYPNHPSARKNLRKQISISNKLATSSN